MATDLGREVGIESETFEMDAQHLGKQQRGDVMGITLLEIAIQNVCKDDVMRFLTDLGQLHNAHLLFAVLKAAESLLHKPSELEVVP